MYDSTWTSILMEINLYFYNRLFFLHHLFSKIVLAPSDIQTPLPLLDFPPLANGFYLIIIFDKTPLHNGTYPIMKCITEMGVAHTVGLPWGLLWLTYVKTIWFPTGVPVHDRNFVLLQVFNQWFLQKMNEQILLYYYETSSLVLLLKKVTLMILLEGFLVRLMIGII